MRYLMPLLSACAALAFSAPACAATFVSTQQLGGDRLVFSITTDDTQGTLQTENLLSYTLQFRGYNLSGEGTGYQGGLYIVNRSPLIAEGSNLIFDSSAAGGLALYGEGGGTGLIISSGIGGAASYEQFVVYGTNEATATLPGRFVFATALPEPSSWLMMLAGFGVAGGMLRHRRQKTAAVSYG
jgi:hypothetical protein